MLVKEDRKTIDEQMEQLRAEFSTLTMELKGVKEEKIVLEERVRSLNEETW